MSQQVNEVYELTDKVNRVMIRWDLGIANSFTLLPAIKKLMVNG